MFDYQGVHGPDVSFYQDDPATPGQINFYSMLAAGADFVIIRCSQNTWVDPDLSYNLIEAKRAGLMVGVYAFYDSRATPEDQASLILALTKGVNLELGIWLDLEERYQGKYSGPGNWRKCLTILRANAPKVGIYTGPGYWNENRRYMTVADLDFFKSFPLWIANYDVTAPAIPYPWQDDDCYFWQIGTPAVGLTYGAESKEIDMNYFNGSREKFYKLFGAIAPGGTMPTAARYTGNAKASATPYLRVRRSYPYGQTDGQINPGQAFEGDRQENGWMHVVSVGGKAVTGWASMAYLENIVDHAPTPDPVGQGITKATIEMADGSLWVADQFTKQ